MPKYLSMSEDLRLQRPSWRGRTNVDALTIACIEHAEDIKREHWPKRPELDHEFVITQGSYQAGGGDQNSAGTHDLGGVVDAHWCGHKECLRALRLAGLAAWHRTTRQGPWPDHLHAAVIDHPALAPSASRQVQAYLDGLDGLRSSGPDDGPRLDPIPRPTWPYPEDITMASADQILAYLTVIDKKVDRLIDKLNSAREREVRGNALLRRLRDDVTDLATLDEIDALLDEEGS